MVPASVIESKNSRCDIDHIIDEVTDLLNSQLALFTKHTSRGEELPSLVLITIILVIMQGMLHVVAFS